MDYSELLTVAADLGYALLRSGAEIYRVEEAIERLLRAYGIAQPAPFVIPNCIIVSFVTPHGEAMTQVRRMPSHGTDIDQLERYYDLGRRLCREVPPLEEAHRQLEEVRRQCRTYSFPVLLCAYFAVTLFFALFFGGTARDALAAGICGLTIGLVLTLMTRLHANLFFKSMLCSALSALLACTLTWLGLAQHSELVIIGALMALVPGIIFTNAIRDVIAGDMVAGLTKIADALLTGVSVALGTGFALSLARLFWGV